VAAKPSGKNQNITAPSVGRLFFPQSQSLGLDRSQYSTAVLAKITYAGSTNTSYQQAHADLHHLAELDVTDKQVRRLCKRVGDERVAQRDAAVAAYQALPLVKRKSAPAGVTPPPVAVVGADGGRMQILERSPQPQQKAAVLEVPQPDVVVATPVGCDPAVVGPALPLALPAADEEASAVAGAEAVPTAAAGWEEEDEERRGQCWREDKIGVLLAMQSEESANDPCPQIPKTFLNPTRMTKLVRELKKRAPPQEEAAKSTADPEAGAEALRANEQRWKPPEVQTKQVVASRRSWPEFGPMVATAAWKAGFFAATRRAFVADGAENNWTMHRQFFSSLCRFWISFMPYRMGSPRPWRVAVSRKAGTCMNAGSSRCGPTTSSR
jgi:hypothetical protein